MFEHQRGESGDILRPYREAFGAELFQRRVDVERIPENDNVQREAQRTELIFLPLAIALPQFAALSMKDGARQLMPVFASIQLSESAPPFGLIIYIGKAVNRLFNATEFSDGLGQFCGPVIHPERPHDRRCLDDTQLERTGQPKHVVPVFLDQICIDAMPCHTIQAAIIGSRIDAPVAGAPISAIRGLNR